MAALESHHRQLTRCLTTATFVFGALLVGAAGCNTWPLQQKERTSITTPAMRIAAIQETGARADTMDPEQQQQATRELALQIRTEPDPLVRRAIQLAISQFRTPLAQEVLLAGLQDADLEVRLACCRSLGERAEPAAVAPLRALVESDDQLDARLAAVDALSQIKSPESTAAIAVALRDPDPAVQFAGVNAMKAVTGEDFGNDVRLWQQYVETGKPPAEAGVSVAERVKQWSPF